MYLFWFKSHGIFRIWLTFKLSRRQFNLKKDKLVPISLTIQYFNSNILNNYFVFNLN